VSSGCATLVQYLGDPCFNLVNVTLQVRQNTRHIFFRSLERAELLNSSREKFNFLFGFAGESHNWIPALV
jgi:hypothetical protein